MGMAQRGSRAPVLEASWAQGAVLAGVLEGRGGGAAGRQGKALGDVLWAIDSQSGETVQLKSWLKSTAGERAYSG